MYICSSCDKEFVKWQGQCESCGEWNCIEEIKIKDNKKSNTLRLVKETKPIKLSSVKVEDNIRFSSNFSEIALYTSPFVNFRPKSSNYVLIG